MLGLIASLPLLFAQAPATDGPVVATPAATAPATAPAATTPVPSPATAPVASPALGTAPATGQPAAPAGKAAEPPASPFSTLIMFLPVGVLFYLMILRPQKQQDKKRKEMVDQMGKNTRVVTSGGMYGTVVSVDKEANTVLLRIGSDPGVKVEFSRSAIVRVIDGTEKDKKDAG